MISWFDPCAAMRDSFKTKDVPTSHRKVGGDILFLLVGLHLCVLYFFGEEQLVNSHRDNFDDHVGRNGQQDAEQAEKVAAY